MLRHPSTYFPGWIRTTSPAYLAARDPDRLIVQQRKDRRAGRIFLDTNRNAYGQMAIAAYSLRARPGPPAATPIDWSELVGSSRTPTVSATGWPRKRSRRPGARTALCGPCGSRYDGLEVRL